MNFGITVGFLVTMLFIGIAKRGKTPDIVNYFVSGRTKSVFTITGSLVATAIGGSATIGLAGMAYSKGAPSLWWLFSGSVGFIILGFLWAGKVREYEVYTLPEVLEKQYGNKLVKIISSLVIVIAWTGIIAAQMIAAGKIMNIIWPGHYQLFITLTAIIFITYTVIGGQNSVISTDLFQTFLIFTGIILTASSAFYKYGNIFSLHLPQGHLEFPFNNNLGPFEISVFFMFVGTSYIAGPDMFSRILSAKDKISAQRSVYLASIVIALFSILIVSIGLYARNASSGIDPESAFQFLIIDTTPSPLQGIVFAALLAAFLSSADTCLLTAGIILTNDLIKPFILKNRLNDVKLLSITKFMIILCGGISLIIAIYVNGILKSLFIALTVYSAGIVLPVILGFYKDKLKINHYGALSGIITGGGIALAMKLMSLDQFLIWIFPLVFLVIIMISRILKE